MKRALLAELGVTPQRLSQITNARKADLPMSTEHAVYTLAHEKGIDLSKHLPADEVAEVRVLVGQLRANGQPKATASPAAAIRPKAKTPKKTVAVTIAGVKIGDVPGLKPPHALGAKTMAERVYPTLYIFENSVRDLVERILEAECGAGWWTTAVPSKVRDTAAQHKTDEEKDPWHGARGQRDLDYLLLPQLWDIIKHQWKHFAPFFPDQAWVQTIITSDMNVSRRVLAHMNPLAEDDIANIENTFRKWVKQLKAKEHLLP